MIGIGLSLMSFINNWSLPYKIEEKQLIILNKGPVLIVLAEIWLLERFLGGKTNSFLISSLNWKFADTKIDLIQQKKVIAVKGSVQPEFLAG